MPSRRILLVFTPLLLLAAIGLVAYGSLRTPEPAFRGGLHDLLPAPPQGWTINEKPIADTPEMKEAVGELLNFDEGVFVDYVGPSGERFSIYIAYWTPGKMSHRLVATHSPDVCWVLNGWKKAHASDTSLHLPTLPVGEARTFEASGRSEYVWFWHLVGTESKRYGTGSAPPWYAAITDIFRKGLNQREEQFFIRLSSNHPLDPRRSPILQETLSRLPWPRDDSR